MLGILGSLGTAIVTGVSDYFKGKQEISKVKLEADKILVMAEANARAEKLKRESEQDYDLDRLSMLAMEKSWKDEFLLLMFSLPVVLCFIPEYRPYIEEGFKTLNIIPEWFMYIYVAMIVVIYGLRGLLRMFLQVILNKFSTSRVPTIKE